MRSRRQDLCTASLLPCLVFGSRLASAQIPQPQDTLHQVSQKQDREVSLEPLERLLKIQVESASKTSHPLSEAPGILTILTAEDIQESGARTLADLLKRVPGVQIGDNRANVLMAWIRGITTTYNEKVLLVIDGIPKRDATLSEWAPDERIDLQNVERIEIIRGPGSAVHGGNAYAGVISIFTRKDPYPSRMVVSGGNEGTAEAGFRGGLATDDFSIVYAARAFKTDGYLSERGLKGAPSDNTNARASKNMQISGSLGSKLSFDLNGADFDYRYPMHEVGSKRDANYTYAMGGVTYKDSWKQGTWASKLYFDNTKIFFNEVVRNPDQTLKQVKEQNKQGLVLGLDSQCSWDFRGDHHILMGLNAERNKATYLEEEWNPTGATPTHPTYFVNSWFSQHGEGPGRNNAGTWNYASFLQGEARLLDHRLSLTAGARYDRFQGFGGELSPRLGFVFALQEGTVFKALWGRAFRPPTFRQLYVVRFDGFQPGEPNLRPERASTYEGELSQRLGPRTNLKLGYFHSKLTDTTLTIADGRWQNSPIPRITSGLEWDLRTEFQVDWGTIQHLSLFLNGAHLLKAYDDTPLGQVAIASVAPTTANLGVTLRSRQLSLFTAWNYVSRRNPGFAYDPGLRQIVYTYHSSISSQYQAYMDRDNKGGYCVQDLTFGWKGARIPYRLELIIRNLWDKIHYNPTHEPDGYYDVLKERRELDLRLTLRF